METMAPQLFKDLGPFMTRTFDADNPLLGVEELQVARSEKSPLWRISGEKSDVWNRRSCWIYDVFTAHTLENIEIFSFS